MWLYVTESRRAAHAMIEDVLSPMLNRPAEELRRAPLPIGTPAACADVLNAYAAAGAQRVFLWPLAEETRQLSLVRGRVAPLLTGS